LGRGALLLGAEEEGVSRAAATERGSSEAGGSRAGSPAAAALGSAAVLILLVAGIFAVAGRGRGGGGGSRLLAKSHRSASSKGVQTDMSETIRGWPELGCEPLASDGC
jgi:hypothetical protein